MADDYSFSLPTEEEIRLLGSTLINAINLTETELSHLPEELLFEIFTKFPTQTVGISRCVSKHWSIALSTPHFIEKHLTVRQKEQQNIILIDTRGCVVINSPTVKQQESTKDLSYVLVSYHFLFGSCNGLLLFVNEKEKLLLVNPTTRKRVKIPDMANIDYDLVPDEWSRALVTYGLGYDCVSDEYKIVAICFYMNYFRPIRETFVQVYSFKKGFWRVLEDSGGYGSMIPTRKSGVFLNGALHWSTGIDHPNSRPLIATFDLASESFHVTEFPAEFNKRKMYSDIIVLGGCLCIMDYNEEGSVDLWMMKEYGVVESWTKRKIRGVRLWEKIKLFCSAGDGEVLGVRNKEKWCLFDVTKGTCREVAVDGRLKVSYCDGGAFVDSLVDPEKLGEEDVGWDSCGGKIKDGSKALAMKTLLVVL